MLAHVEQFTMYMFVHVFTFMCMSSHLIPLQMPSAPFRTFLQQPSGWIPVLSQSLLSSFFHPLTVFVRELGTLSLHTQQGPVHAKSVNLSSKEASSLSKEELMSMSFPCSLLSHCPQ